MTSGRQPGIAAHRLSGHHREGAALGTHTSSRITRMNVGCGVLFKLGFLGHPRVRISYCSLLVCSQVVL